MKKPKFRPAGRLDGELLPAQTTPPRRILVVNDNGEIRQLSAAVLIRAGYAVDAAADAEAAWCALNSARYDLLITDHQMRKMSGVELLTKLRVSRMALPVIMASAILPRGKFTRFPWLQPAVTLPKPYTVAEFLGTVQAVLNPAEGSCGPTAPPPNESSQSSQV
jgi:DNA-binding response OmpR family regulator